MPPGCLRLLACGTMPRSFHAQFSATWRRYVYLLPLRNTSPSSQHPALPAQPGNSHSHDVSGAYTPLPPYNHEVSGSDSAHSPHNQDVNGAYSAHSPHSHVNGECSGHSPLPPHSHQASGECSGHSVGRAALPDSSCSSGDAASSTVVTSEANPHARPHSPHEHEFSGSDSRAAWLSAYLAQDPGCQDVDPALVHALLQPLVNVPLDYTPFARDTPKGKDTSCKLLLACATRITLPLRCNGGQEGVTAAGGGASTTSALCVELVASRFLRKMVRVLVSTVVMEALAIQAGTHAASLHDAVGSAMLHHCGPEGSRQGTGLAAPAEGLCFAGVGYDEANWTFRQ